MTDEHNIQPDHNREQKRARFAQPVQEKNKTVSILIIIFAALAAVAVYLVVSSMNERPAPAPVVVATGGTGAQAPSGSDNTNAPKTSEIAIPISDVSSGRAKFFEYKASDSTSVRFFAVKSRDGAYRVAMDACEVCFHAKKGYQQDGDDMVCKNCGRRFAISRIGEIQGGCHPISVPRSVEGNSIVVKASELESRARYFQ